MTIVKALKSLYVKLGGSLTDTYDDIADGTSVSNYSVTSDIIEAVSRVSKNVDVSAIPLVIDIIETPHSDGGSVTYTYSVVGVEKMSEIVSAMSDNKPVVARLTRLNLDDTSKVSEILDCQPITYFPYGSTGEGLPDYCFFVRVVNTQISAIVSLQPTSESDDTVEAIVNYNS